MLEIVRALGRSDVIVYIGMAGAAWLIAALAMTVLFLLLVAPTSAFDTRPDGSTANWPFLVWLPLLILAAPVATIVLSESFGITTPELRAVSIDEKAAHATQETAKLADRAGALRAALSKPGDVTLNQMQQVLADTLGLSDELAKRLAEQDAVIQSLRTSVEAERAKADESRRLAQEVQSLTRGQLEAITLLITRDANDASRRSFLIGVAVSLPIGVFGSLVAAWLLRRFGGKAHATIERAVAVRSAQPKSQDTEPNEPLQPTSGP